MWLLEDIMSCVTKRNSVVDIMKGIAIILVVMDIRTLNIFIILYLFSMLRFFLLFRGIVLIMHI